MVVITVDSQSGKTVIEANGHAGYAPHGQDIVCAAVSTILQTAILGLEAMAHDYPDHVSVIHK